MDERLTGTLETPKMAKIPRYPMGSMQIPTVCAPTALIRCSLRAFEFIRVLFYVSTLDAHNSIVYSARAQVKTRSVHQRDISLKRTPDFS